MVCKKCDTINEDGMKFCVGCGEKLVDDVETPDASTVAAAAAVTEDVAEATADVVEEAKVEAAPVIEEVKAEEIVEEVKPVETASKFAKEIEPASTTPVSGTVETASAAGGAAVAGAAVAGAAVAGAAASDKAAKKMEKAAAKEAKKEAKKQAKRQKILDKKAKEMEIIDAIPATYKPMSVSKYFWLTVLFGIPGIGFLFTMLLSFIPRNRNLKNFARSAFIIIAIPLIVSLIGGVIVSLGFPEVSETIIDGISEILSAIGL